MTAKASNASQTCVNLRRKREEGKVEGSQHWVSWLTYRLWSRPRGVVVPFVPLVLISVCELN